MTDTPEIRSSRQLLQTEAAALLRCSESTVKRLRLGGELGYSKRRPVTIGMDDLESYVARAKVRRALQKQKRRASQAKGQSGTFAYVSAGAVPAPFTLLTSAEAGAKFGRTARQIRYLRLRGRVPYIPGRPPLIDATDLADYLERKRLAALAKTPPTPGSPAFDALQKQKARNKGDRRLHKRVVRRRVARILEEIKARATKII